jgi:transcriptional regulator with XRE-family HTH domain
LIISFLPLIVGSEENCIFVTICQDIKIQFKAMMFTERIKQLRDEYQIPQRVLAAALEIDTASYCKIEKGERKVKREQVFVIAKLLKVDTGELINLWLAEQVYHVVKNEEHANKVLNIVAQKL